jgi:hypothetical protein
MVVIMSINRQRRIEATYEDNNTSFLENKGSTSLQQVRSSKASTLKKKLNLRRIRPSAEHYIVLRRSIRSQF